MAGPDSEPGITGHLSQSLSSDLFRGWMRGSSPRVTNKPAIV